MHQNLFAQQRRVFLLRGQAYVIVECGQWDGEAQAYLAELDKVILSIYKLHFAAATGKFYTHQRRISSGYYWFPRGN
ncbi:MAG: hypothetical protein ACLPM3_03935 [Terracidiphilus sp.]